MRYAAAILPALLGLMSGCARPELHPGAYRAPVPEPLRHSVALVEIQAVGPPEGVTPTFNVKTGKGKEAAKGGVMGAGILSAAMLVGSLGAGPMGPALIPILVPAGAALGAGAGAIEGGTRTPAAKTGKKAKEILAGNQADLSKELGRRLALRLPPGVTVGPAGASDLKITVSVGAWGLSNTRLLSGDPEIELSILTSCQVFMAGKADPILTRTFRAGGQRRRLSVWTSEKGALVSQDLQAALDAAAEGIADEVFRVHDFFLDNQAWSSQCGQAPVSVSELKSRRPLLAWAAFPRPIDLEHDEQGLLARISQVTYELRIWKAVSVKPNLGEKLNWGGEWRERFGGAGPLVYERQGVAPEPASGSAPKAVILHQVETHLQPGTRYLWSVRAHFLLDGKERVTRWSMKSRPWDMEYRDADRLPGAPPCYCLRVGIPPGRYHDFRIP